MTGLGILFIGGIAVLFAVVAVVLMRAENRRDPFGPEDDPDGLPPLGERPPEIAHEPPRPSIHELPPLGDAVWHQLPIRGDAQGREGGCAPADSRPAARADLTGSLSPRPLKEDPGPLARGGPGQTSPAATTAPPVRPGTGAGPGDEAAAAVAPGATPPGAAPPPLPDAIVTYDHDPAEIAAAAPWAVPFKAWESDTFVGRVEAIRGHGGTAGMEAQI